MLQVIYVEKTSKTSTKTSTSKIQFFVTLVNSSKPLVNVAESSVLDISGVLDTPSRKKSLSKVWLHIYLDLAVL